MLAKDDLRKHFRITAQKLASDVGTQSAWAKCALEFFKTRSGTWGTYQPRPDEPNCGPVHAIPVIQWMMPRVIGESMKYENFDSPQLLPTENIQGLLIPGLAFDESGYRLGRGGGHFDRYLKNFNGLRVGVCFEKQIVPELPREAHDEPMNFLLTEAGVKEIPRGSSR